MNISSRLRPTNGRRSVFSTQGKDELGDGFPSARPEKRSFAKRVQDRIASADVLGLPSRAVNLILDRVSGPTENSIGINVQGLMEVERRLYKDLASGSEGYQGDGQPAPLFKALADGQASYVSLGPNRQSEADHMMLLFNGTSREQLKEMRFADPELAKVRNRLLEMAKEKEFPVFVDTDNSFESRNPTELIAAGSLRSIARRENGFGEDFSNPQAYYKWLLTRVHSNYAKLDPWLFATNPSVHESINVIKENLTPPWIESPRTSRELFGADLSHNQVQKAYTTMMELAGSGKAPTWDTLRRVADTVIGLDRDLLSGVQTYWIKLLSEVSPEQRETLLAPVARSWVNLNVVGPGHPEFERVSPPTSPMIELVSRKGHEKLERYDRALALSQAVDHAVNGLSLGQRRPFIDDLMREIGSKEAELLARDARLKESLGEEYVGLDIQALLSGEADIRTPGVKEALDQLIAASESLRASNHLSDEYSEICRHRDLMDWVATRHARYGDLAFDWVVQNPQSVDLKENPLILSEYYSGDGMGNVSPITEANYTGVILGESDTEQEPMRVSVVLEGGGGKGFAYADVLEQFDETLAEGPGQVRVDEFVGNSAGAISAGILAAGYQGEELGQILEELDFTTFYSDYLWLSGGVDPKVRGMDRTGLFTTQKMYQTLSDLLKKKVPIEGRPVLFRDLPFKLRVTATMLNGDISEELREKMELQPDGQLVFSSETTPNMDVAAALCCSAAIPAFFHAPQLQVCTGSEDGKPELSRMQLMDGGVVNNFPVAEASKDEKSFMMMLPTSFQAPSPTPGGEPISLSTLDFDSRDVKYVDAYNREQFKSIRPRLKQTLQTIGEAGYGRAVLSLNLTKMDGQQKPVIQGGTREETNRLLDISSEQGFPTVNAEQGARLVEGNLPSKGRGLAERLLVDRLLDKDDVFSPRGTPRFRPSTQEASGPEDVIMGAAAALLSAPAQLDYKIFEKRA